MNPAFDAHGPVHIEPQLAAMLDTLRATPARDPDAIQHGRADFLAQATALRAGARSTLAKGPTTWGSPTAARSNDGRLKLVVRPLLGILLAGGIVFAGGATAVFAAQTSLPDEPLYRVKSWSEDARLVLAREPQARLTLMVEFAERRQAELEALRANHRQANAEVLKEIGDQVDDAIRTADVQTNEAARDELVRVRGEIERQQSGPEFNPASSPATLATPNVPAPTPTLTRKARPTAKLTVPPLPTQAPGQEGDTLEPGTQAAPTSHASGDKTSASPASSATPLSHPLPSPVAAPTHQARPIPTRDVSVTPSPTQPHQPRLTPLPQPSPHATRPAVETELPQQPEPKATRRVIPTVPEPGEVQATVVMHVTLHAPEATEREHESTREPKATERVPEPAQTPVATPALPKAPEPTHAPEDTNRPPEPTRAPVATPAAPKAPEPTRVPQPTSKAPEQADPPEHKPPGEHPPAPKPPDNKQPVDKPIGDQPPRATSP